MERCRERGRERDRERESQREVERPSQRCRETEIWRGKDGLVEREKTERDTSL